MTATEFEILTQKLFIGRLKKEFGYDIPVDHQRTFTSLTGNTYKIDVSYSFKLFDIDYLTLVECKYWDSYVTREKIGYFKAILDDLKAHKGIIVTSKGFQSGAVTYAKSQKIGLVKITNNRYFETYSHVDGGLDLLENFLIREEALNAKDKFTSLGLFFPDSNINDFIRVHYGPELADFLENELSPQNLNNLNIDIKTLVRKVLENLPDSWYEDYTLYETAGLNYKLINEPELRLLNIALHLLKAEQLDN